jgi:hypothetical protein
MARRFSATPKLARFPHHEARAPHAGRWVRLSIVRWAQLGFLAHLRPVRALRFAPEGRTLASGCAGGMVKLWDMVDRQYREPARNRNPLGVRFMVGVLAQRINPGLRGRH